MQKLQLRLGIKSDPVQYRYSYPWLFELMDELDVRFLQLGSFGELYHLPDEYFCRLRAQAEARGIRIASVFTAHRELGGFFMDDPAWERVARRNLQRLIEVAGLLGADCAGSAPGAAMRDRLHLKDRGVETYLAHAKELLHFAHRAGVSCLTMEPMSCLAEPPTLPEEIRHMCETLVEYRKNHPDTAAPGFCTDISHGYADAERHVIHTNLELLEAALPWTVELHLKNTDEIFNATFGFGPEERERGIVELQAVRELLEKNAHAIPVPELICYLELPGPKIGRDYTDALLETQLRQSIEHIQTVFPGEPRLTFPAPPRPPAGRPVYVSASLMCADAGHFEEDVRRLEGAGCDWLHLDVMDAHFVPNMPVGLGLVGAARELSELPLDVHLMVDNNDFFIERLAPFKPDWVSIHAESATHLDRSLQLIRSIGAHPGVALNPGTPLSALDYVLEQLDFVLIMTVNPGYAGQKIVPAGLRKIEEARRYLDERDSSALIQVDGNVSFEYIPRMVAAGADVLVAGTSSVFSTEATIPRNFRRVRQVIAEGLAKRARSASR
jgi:ribulose-phosphate 3-epimerase